MKLIIISGRSNSGKTSLRNFLSDVFQMPAISASDYTKSLTPDHSRENLEFLFNTQKNTIGFEGIAKNILDFWFYNSEFWILDGARHYALIQAFEKILWKPNILLIHIDISQKNRFLLAQKAQRMEAENLKTFEIFEKNSTHEKYADTIWWYANITIWNKIISEKSQVYENLKEKISFFLKNHI